jgi:hypothetical protein
MSSFFRNRMAYLKYEYDTPEGIYQANTIAEFEKLAGITDDALNLWFEQDLFCQTNLWFTCAYLLQHNKSNSIYLIMPPSFTQYGFGALNSKELTSLYNHKKPFLHLKEFAALWEFYRLGNNEELWRLALELSDKFPFLKLSVQAHFDRLRTKDSLGRPMNSLIRIIKDMHTTEFEPVFKEFCTREGIYGFGDSQVKRFFDEIITNRLYEL